MSGAVAMQIGHVDVHLLHSPMKTADEALCCFRLQKISICKESLNRVWRYRPVRQKKNWLPSSSTLIELLADAGYWKGVAVKLRIINVCMNDAC